MVEMPMMPTQPSADPVVATPPADADAPQGAFEEMLARRLGRQLVGRFADDDDRETAGGGNGEPSPWMPPTDTISAMTTAAAQPVLPGDLAGTAPAVPTSPIQVDGTPNAVRQVEGATRPQMEGATRPQVEPTPIKVHVNRPGFPVRMAEPGLIQPGPAGEIWTHPSGVADLRLTRTTEPGATPIASSAPDQAQVVEPPPVRWNPAPARAALAAAANRDLELEIVSQLRAGAANRDQADLRLVGDAQPSTVPTPVRSTARATNDGPIESVPNVAAATSEPAPGSPVATGPTPVPPAPTPQPSALIDRVLNAVELQRHLPPPRAISVEIPEMEGLRLLVTMRMDGTVHVAPSSATHGPNAETVTPLLQAVNEALTERGFDMSADTGGRQGANEEPEAAPQQRREPRARRMARRRGLRI